MYPTYLGTSRVDSAAEKEARPLAIPCYRFVADFQGQPAGMEFTLQEANEVIYADSRLLWKAWDPVGKWRQQKNLLGFIALPRQAVAVIQMAYPQVPSPVFSIPSGVSSLDQIPCRLMPYSTLWEAGTQDWCPVGLTVVP